MMNNVNKENKQIWNTNADFWNDKMGADGNDYHRKLIAPSTINFLNLQPTSKILDIGCGNGLFARRLAKKGIAVTAFDFAEGNIRNAKQHDNKGIDYHVLDATNYDDLVQLGNNQFDGAAANMVLMDMPEIDTLFKALTVILKKGSPFVFSVSHPCFNSTDNVKIEKNNIIIKDYINPLTFKGDAITNQPKLQYYFHRTISEYFNIGFRYGFVVDGIEEPIFENKPNSIFTKIPPVIIVKMKMC